MEFGHVIFCLYALFLLMIFLQSETESSQSSDCGSDYVPASESDTDFDEPPITAKQTHSTIQHLGDSLMHSDKIVGEVNVGETQPDVSLMYVDTSTDPSYSSSNSKDHATSPKLLLINYQTRPKCVLYL